MTEPFSLGMGDPETSDSVPAVDWHGFTLAFALAFVLYAISMSPVVFWGDSAEFSMKAAELELTPIARGYPLHRLLTFLAGHAVGDFAFGANLVSVIFGALTVALLYEAGRMIGGNRAAGVAAACVTGVAHTFWTYAGIAEVYTLHTAFMAASFVLLLRAPFEGSPGPLSLGVLLGVSLLHHRLLIFAFPGLGLWLLAAAPPGGRLAWARRSIAGFFLGAIPFAVLCVVNSRAPPAGVDASVTWWLSDVFFGGDANQGFLFGEGRKSAFESAAYLTKFVGLNLTPVAGLLACWGLIVAPRLLGMRIAVALWVLVLSHVVFPFRYDWTGDQYVFLLPLYPLCSLLVAAAVGHIATRSGPRAAGVAAVLTAIVPVALYSTLGLTDIGRRQLPGLTDEAVARFFLPVRLADRTPRDWCAAQLDAVPAGGILHCQWGDGTVYRYLQQVERMSPHVQIEVWYSDTIPLEVETDAQRLQWVSVMPLDRALPPAVANAKDRLRHLEYLRWEQREAQRKEQVRKRAQRNLVGPEPPPVPPMHGLYRYYPPRDGK